MSEYEPITAELRELLADVNWTEIESHGLDGWLDAWHAEADRRCDAIDAVHAQLERENAELRERVAVLDNERGNMHDGGRITGELRAWWVRKFPVMDKELHKDFTAIADRIDAENENACAEAYGNGVMSVPIALDESQWVKLPLDADGVPIRVEDVMEWVSPDEDFKPVIRAVDGVGEQSFFAWTKDSGRYAQYEARAYRHHHGQTVEDVLTEFAAKLIERSELTNGAAQTISEYAQRLTLAEGDAE